MATAKENLLSLGHLTGSKRNTFTNQREHIQSKSVNGPMLFKADFSTNQHLRTMQLQQRWQELTERELTAQKHNKQLLQQFEEAQDTLRGMLTLTAAMKTIRTEYERYLDENSPRWKQQLKEKTQTAKKKRMEEYLRSCLQNAEERETKVSADRQGPAAKLPNAAAPQKPYSQTTQLDNNQDVSLHLPYDQTSWLTKPSSQMAGFPIRAAHQPQRFSYAPHSFPPPPIFQHPHPLHLPFSTPTHHQPSWPRQNPSVWASPQPDYPLSWAAGAAGIPAGSEALWGQLFTDETQVVVEEEAEKGGSLISKEESGGESRSSPLSQELDVKPVRLSSGHTESESSRESSHANREKRKRREKSARSQLTSSDRDGSSSQESSSAIVIAAAVTAAAKSSESGGSSEGGRTSASSHSSRRRKSSRRTSSCSGGLAVGSPRAEKAVKERSGSEGVNSEDSHKEKSGSAAGEEVGRGRQDSGSEEKAEDGNPEDKSESCGEESRSQREEEEAGKTENGGEDDEEEKDESSRSSEESSVGEKEQGKHLGDGGDDGCAVEKDGQGNGEERDVEDKDEASDGMNTTEGEEEETGPEEEEEKGDGLKDGESSKPGPISSQEEEESDGCDGQSDEEEEEKKTGQAQEERDSDDSIISPQVNRSKKTFDIAEEAGEDDEEEEEEEGSKTGSSEDDSNGFSDEDIEHLLAPQERAQKKGEKDPKADEKPKAICDNAEIFQVGKDRSQKSDQHSDSDEFDHFYD